MRPESKTYFQVTSKRAAEEIRQTGKIRGIEFSYVYAFDQRPSRKEALCSGARHLETVIQFQTRSDFERDPEINPKVARIAKISVFPGPIAVTDVREVPFSKPRWKIW